MVLLKLLTTTLFTISLAINSVTARHEKRQLDVVWADKRESIVPRAVLPVDGPQGRDIKLPPQARASSNTHRRSPTKARRAGPPPNPSNVPLSGYIEVTRKDTGASLGYVKKNFLNNVTNKRFGLTTNTGLALSISGTWDSVGPIQLTMTNGPDSNNPYFGFVVAPNNSSNDLSNNSSNVCFATGTHSIAAQSPPSANGNSFSTSRAESTIWNYDTITKQLTAQWVNTNGSKPTTLLYYVTSTDTLLIGGTNTQASGAIPVAYTVV